MNKSQKKRCPYYDKDVTIKIEKGFSMEPMVSIACFGASECDKIDECLEYWRTGRIRESKEEKGDKNDDETRN